MSNKEDIVGDKKENLERAIADYTEAVGLYTNKNFTVQRVEIKQYLPKASRRRESFGSIIVHIKENLETTEDCSLQWSETQNNLDKADQELITREESKLDKDSISKINDQNIIWKRGNQILALASGGAFLGGLFAQMPGSIIGAIIAAIYGIMLKEKTN